MTRLGRARRADSRYAEQGRLLAAYVLRHRNQQGLIQEQRAFRVGVAVSTLRKIETGAVTEPCYFTVMPLLQVLRDERFLVDSAHHDPVLDSYRVAPGATEGGNPSADNDL